MTRRTYEKPTLVREEMLQFVVAFGLTRGDKANNGLENGENDD